MSLNKYEQVLILELTGYILKYCETKGTNIYSIDNEARRVLRCSKNKLNIALATLEKMGFINRNGNTYQVNKDRLPNPKMFRVSEVDYLVYIHGATKAQNILWKEAQARAAKPIEYKTPKEPKNKGVLKLRRLVFNCKPDINQKEEKK